jgi:hypothetical protein
MSIGSSLRQRIAARDRHRCAYCLTAEAVCGLRMHVDHIIPEVIGGETVEENLCLACFSCNIFKGRQVSAEDPETFEREPLFHPLREKWSDHFTWSEDQTLILGLTPVGRATVQALKLNNPTVVRARVRWVQAGWHPPRD